MSLLGGGISSHGGYIDHAVAEFDKRASLDGDVEIRHVVQDEVDEFLVFVFADPFDEAVGGEFLAELEGSEAVFRKAKVEEGCYGDAGWFADLFLLLVEVGAADESDGAFLTESGKDGEDFGRCVLWYVRGCCYYGNKWMGGKAVGKRGETNKTSRCQCAIHIEQTNRVSERTILEGRISRLSSHDCFSKPGKKKCSWKRNKLMTRKKGR